MNLFNQKDLRSVVRGYIASLPKAGRGEITRIAKTLGVSTTLVSHVISGSKIFTAEQVQSLVEHMGLGGLEADYLTYLVQYERAGSEKLKKVWRAKLDETREKSLRVASRVATDRTLSDRERAIFYSSPIYSAIRLFCTVGDKGQTLSDICERSELSRARASAILKFLVESGLAAENGDRYVMGAQKTHVEQGSPHLLKHHSNWRLRAIRQGEDLSDRELMYTAPVSLSRQDFDQLREEMVVFIKHFLDRVHASPAEDIACFNLDFFWIRK